MPEPPKKAAQPLQLFRPPKRNVHGLLDVDVLDDDTRRMLMNDIWNAPPAVLDDVPRTTTTTTTSAATSTSPGPNKDSFPDHLRKEVHQSTNTNKSTNNTSNSDGTLMAAMASRLASVEKKLSAYQHELREMHEKHRAANNNLQKERTLREDAENVVLTLYEERKEMEEDLRLLHHALSDKGFQWRDNKLWEVEPGTTPPPPREATPTSSHGSGYDVMKGDYDATTPRETPPTSARPRMTAPTTTTATTTTVAAAASSSTSAPIDVDKLMYNARILSDHIGWKGIVSDGRRGALQDRDVVRVVVYSNGICINNGPFRPYGWPLCEAFIDDLLDGFYPYEYKERYPDGFPIEVTDQRHVPCAAGATSTSGDAATRTTQQQSEKNGGQRLGGRIVDTQRDVMRNDGGYREMSKEEFLQRLPKQMISPNGHMCEVRETVANLCGVVLPNNNNNNNKKSAPVKLPAASASASAARALEEGEVEVHVRLPSGHVATLRMHVDRTVADLRKLLMTKMEPTSSIARGDFELCQAYPPQSYNEHTATLREAGIIRSCTLMLRNGATTSPPTSVATEVPQLPPPPPPSSSSVATGQSFKLRPRRKPGTS